MAVRSEIQDGHGNNNIARVLSEGELLVNTYTCPPLLPQKNRIFSQFFTRDGTPGGDNDLGIDASSAEVNFYIEADNDSDRYFSALSFVGEGVRREVPFQW